MDKLEFCYRDWLAEEKASILNLVKTTFSSRGRQISCIDLEQISIAFDIAAECHDEKNIRDSGEPYLTHPIAVAIILLMEFSDTNITQILIAILHDTGEKDIAFISVIAQRLSRALADSVRAISKKELDKYVSELSEMNQCLFHSDEIITNNVPVYAPHISLSKEQLDIIQQGRELLKKGIKGERNHEYFSGLDGLDDDELSAKFADRLHNLRTLKNCSLEKQQSTVESTTRYFLPVAIQRNPLVYNLLLHEVLKAEEEIAKETFARTKINNRQKIDALFGTNL